MTRTGSRLRSALTVAGFVAAAVGVVLLWLALSSALPSTHKEYRLTASAPDVSGLAAGANVTIAGLNVGRVESVRRQDGMGRMTISVKPRYAPLPADTRFGVRLRTIVGENYLELYPGRSKAKIPSGGALAHGRMNEYVDVDRILNTLRGRTRERARETIQGLAAGVRGRGDRLNQTLDGAAGVVNNAEAPLTELADHRQQVARLVDDLGTITAAVGRRGDDLREVARAGRVTAAAVASRDDALRRMLAALPSTLTQVRRTTGTLDAVSGRAAPVVTNLASAVNRLKPTVTNLRPAAAEGGRVLALLGAVSPALGDTLDRLRALAPQAHRALPALRGALCEINPLASYLRPYSREIIGVIQGMGSAGNYYDANGHAVRLRVTIGESSFKGLDPTASRALDLLLKSGLVSRSHAFGYDPGPGAGNADQTATSTSDEGPATVSKKFPRVHAEC